MRIRDLNWMQLEEYLASDDRVVLPVGSTEQHAYLSLETDNIIAERLAVEAAQPLNVPVLPVLAYGLTQGFAAYPGSPTLRLGTYAALLRDILESLHGQAFRRFLIANGHGGNTPGAVAVAEWARAHEAAAVLWHDVWEGRQDEVAAEIDTDSDHASWWENFPWTRLPGRREAERAKAGACRPASWTRSAGGLARGARRRILRRPLPATRRGRAPPLGHRSRAVAQRARVRLADVTREGHSATADAEWSSS